MTCDTFPLRRLQTNQPFLYHRLDGPEAPIANLEAHASWAIIQLEHNMREDVRITEGPANDTYPAQPWSQEARCIFQVCSTAVVK
jgi:hypothetical protein